MQLVRYLLHLPINAQCRRCVASGWALMAPHTQSPRRGTCCFRSYSPHCTLGPPQIRTATTLAAHCRLSRHLGINRVLKLLPHQGFENIRNTEQISSHTFVFFLLCLLLVFLNLLWSLLPLFLLNVAVQVFQRVIE